MDNIQVHHINSYSAEITINGKKIQVVDRVKKHELFVKRRNLLSSICIYGGMTLGITAFFYLLGIAGHSDFVSEMHIADDWSNWDYTIRMIYSFACMGIAGLIVKYGEYVQSLNRR